MAAPCRLKFYQLLQRQLLKFQNQSDRIICRKSSFTNKSFKNDSFYSHRLKSVGVLAGVFGVSSVFVAKSIWNSVKAAEQPVTVAVRSPEHVIYTFLIYRNRLRRKYMHFNTLNYGLNDLDQAQCI